MTSPDNYTVGDIVTRLEFSLSSDALDFQKTGKGVLVVEDGQASLPLPTGPRGPVGHLTKDDKAFLDDRSDAAASSAAAAKTSETNAKSSETKAKTSETSAKTSETKAKASEEAAASSASSALSSKSAADSSATAAANSASDALESKNAAGVSRTAAAASAAATKTSEDNAKASETAAASSSSAASSSQSAAASSASAAKTSETNAKTSETKAKDSETASASSATASAESASAADLAKSGAEDAAGDADRSRQVALEHEQGAKAHREASEAAQLGSEKARDLAEDYRDGAKAHREEAGLSRDDAAASASSANTSANTASAKATEISNKIQQALDAVDDVEQVKRDLQDLMADTEAWNSVQSAIEQVDFEIAAAMQQVKDDILGGVGPAFDTLLELAEALGDNADAIATITNQLADKAEKGHTHTSAEITDTVKFFGSEVSANRVVTTHDDGQLHSSQHPTSYNHLTRKGWVDQEVAKKANTGHTHTIANVSGLQTALNGKAPTSHIHAIKDVDGLEAQLSAKSADGHKHVIDDVTDLTKELDTIKDHVDGQGASIIPFNSVTGRQRWADGLIEANDAEAPTGRYYFNGDGWEQGRHYFFQVDPTIKYYAAMWVKADKPGSRVYIELRDQNGTHAVKTGNLNGAGTYLLGDYELPTEWTLLTTDRLEFREGVTSANINTPYFNHSNGTERDAVQMLSDIQLIPLAPHKHDPADIGNARGMATSSNGAAQSRHIMQLDVDGHFYQGTNPTSNNHLTRKGYVDSEVGKKADKDHTHTSADITDTLSWIGAGGLETGGKRLVLTHYDGYLHCVPIPTDDNHVPNKKYVDQEVSKKADASHTHTSSDIADAVDHIHGGRAGRLVVVGEHGHIRDGNPPTDEYDLANKQYVDREVGKKADKDHTHGVADINATGTRGSTTYLRGDGTWVAPPNTTYSLVSQSEAEAGTATTARTWSAQRVRQAVAAYAPSKGALDTGLAGKADKAHTHTAADVGARPDTWTPTAAQVGAATPAYVDQRIQLVSSWPSNPVAGVLYLMEE